jgi:hypothetical protein
MASAPALVHSALADLLGVNHATADIHTLYAYHDRLLENSERSSIIW